MLHVDIKKRLTEFTLSLTFQMGNEIVALYGPSGSGKTTTLHCIAGITSIDAGEITLGKRIFVRGGQSLIPIEERQIGYVFQQYALFPHKTVWQNIAYGMKDELLTQRLIERLQLTHLLEKYPHEISGGEKQRTAFIRALATKPQLLLLDEPFSALDDQVKQQSYEQLRSIHEMENIPIILVTHDRHDINYVAHRKLEIADGRLINDQVVNK